MRAKERRDQRIELTQEHAEQQRHRNEALDPTVTMLPCEIDDDNIEYKFRLKDLSHARLEQLITQMKFRLSEGSGECFYYIGVEDHGYPRGLTEADLRVSLSNLNTMAEALRATAALVRVFPGAHSRWCALVQVRRNCVEDVNYTELRVCVGGSVDNGKSSLIAVLTHGVDGSPVLDNGRGSARTSVFRHKHEIQTGHTSSISQTMLGYDSSGQVLNYAGFASLTSAEISAAAHKVLHFIDLGGHERFLKTALYGMTSLLPDFMMLCVCASTGVARITKEHFAAAVALDIPVLCVVTKADSASPATLARTLQDVRTLLAAAADAASREGDLRGGSTDEASDADAFPMHDSRSNSAGGMFDADIDTEADLRRREVLKRKLDRQVPVISSTVMAEHVSQVMCIIQQQRHPLRCRSYMIPCFVTSAVTGAGIDLLHSFLVGLKQSARHKQPHHLHQARSTPDAAAPQPSRAPHPPTPFTAVLGTTEGAPPPPDLSFSAFVDLDAAPNAAASPALTHDASETLCGSPVSESPADTGVDRVREQSLDRPPNSLRSNGGAGGSGHVTERGVHSEERCPADRAELDPKATSRAALELNGGPMHSAGVSDAGGSCEAFGRNERGHVAVDTIADASQQAGWGWPAPSVAPPGEPPAVRDRPALERSDSSVTGRFALPGAEPPGVSGHELVHFQIESTFFGVMGVGTVVSGTVVMGTIRVGDQLWWGPNGGGDFTMTQVVSIHRSQVPVIKVQAGQTGTLALESASPAGPPPMLSSLSLPSLSASAGGRLTSLGLIPRDASPSIARHSNTALPSHGAPGLHEAQNAATDATDAPEAAHHPATDSGESPTGQGEGGRDLLFEPLGSGAGSLSRQLGARRRSSEEGERASQPLLGPGEAPERCRSAGDALPRAARSSLSNSRLSGSPDAMSPDPSWHRLGLGLAGLPEEADDASLMSKGRKGTVLLDSRLSPRTASEFNAVMVLLNGQWPPRGLVSGRWPPDADSDDQSGGASPGHSGTQIGGASSRDRGRRSRTRSHRPKYKHMIHCGNIRQEAVVCYMQELPASAIDEIEVGGMSIVAASAAAAVLGDPSDDDDDGEGCSQEHADFVRCVVEIKFKFTLRPEWIQPGMRFIVRDHGGHISGAGVLAHVNTTG